MFNPPWTADFIPKPPSAASTAMDDRRGSGLWGRSMQSNPQEQTQPRNPGPYQYYQASSLRLGADDKRRSFSERTGGSATMQSDDTGHSDARPIRDRLRVASDSVTRGPLKEVLAHGGTTSDDLAETQHIVSAPGTFPSEEDESPVDPDAVPSNLRAKPWSPEPTAPSPEDAATSAVRRPSDEPNMVRRDSIPHRSPLQKLEGHLGSISKEEKRSRLEDAEENYRKISLSGQGKQARTASGDVQRSGTLRSEKGRVVSDGSRRPSESTSDRWYQDQPRNVSTGAPLRDSREENKARRVSETVREPLSPRTAPAETVLPPRRQRSEGPRDRVQSTQQNQLPPILIAPQPYHHAPEAPRTVGIRQNPRPYHHAPEAPRNLGIAKRPIINPSASTDPPDTVAQRSASGNYQRRLRDAGFAGAAVAAGTGAAVPSHEMTAAERGKAAHERRSSQRQNLRLSTAQSTQPSNVGVLRSGSTDLQKKGYALDGAREQSSDGKARSQHNRVTTTGSLTHQQGGAGAFETSDSTVHREDATEHRKDLAYKIPPQTVHAQEAREQVGFHSVGSVGAGGLAGAAIGAAASADPHEKHHRFGHLFHRKDERRSYIQSGAPLEEWKNAPVARLDLADMEFARQPSHADTEATKDSSPWWEKGRGGQRARTSSASGPGVASAQLDGQYEEEATMFRPQLFLRCGPLLRYTGIRRETADGRPDADVRAIWRGTIMIVTEDSHSDLTSGPMLRIFAQPMDLLELPSREAMQNGHELSPELEDPVAGQVKVSRTGRPLYVRPVHDIEGGVDLSREENNNGLYSATRAPRRGTQSSSAGIAAGGQDPSGGRNPSQLETRIGRRDGEKAGRHKQVKAVRLHTERGLTFWRFGIEIELASTQRRVAYRINNGPALGFWVPGRSESMNIMFHSCNGFSLSVNSNDFSGPDPLWRDVLNRHQSRPFHVMVGGGDQIYNDAAMRDTELFGAWTRLKNPDHKHSAQFTLQMQEELEDFYINRYAMWFSQGLFAMAGSQIPMVNVWDDHDIMDGYGSYPHRLMASRVFTGLGAVAFKYYMLFQHQSLVAETEKEEPSWVLGSSPGPYINELSRSIFLDLGPHVKFLGLDCRTERMRDEILSQDTYDLLFTRCEREIQKGSTKHLIVLLGVPIAYPRLNFLENILTSRVMDPIKAIGRTGMLGGFVNKFDGGVEILDDLDDHWTAKHHKAERNWFIQELQSFAAEKSVRVTILGGDVHLGAVGQFYTPRKFGISKDKDHRYMPNVISSAIVNTPPPPMMADVLNRRNKIHHLDSETDEDLIPMFDADVDGSKRNNKCLLPRRNYCTIREYVPGHTPPPSPRFEDAPEAAGTSRSNSIQDEGLWSAHVREERDRRFPPGSMRRTMSLTRSGAGNLLRRLSGSSKSRTSSSSTRPQISGPIMPGMGRSNSLSNPPPGAGGSYFPPTPDETTERPTFRFHRRPTNLSEKEIRKAAAKGGAPPDEELGDDPSQPPPGHIDLEGGLDISLNMEVDQHDPSGHTQPYRLLVPALFYEGGPDANNTRIKPLRTSFVDRLKSVRRRKEIEDDDGSGNRTPSPPPVSAHQNSRQTQQPASVPSGRLPFGNDGTQDPQVGSTAIGGPSMFASHRPTQIPPGRQSMDGSHTRGAYDNGYNLSAPPIGTGHYDPPLPLASNPVNASTYPLGPASAPYGNSQPATATRVPASRQQPRPATSYNQFPEPEVYTEGSLTPSDELTPSLHREVLPQRRPSKAERFFGIGDAVGPESRGGGHREASNGDAYGEREKKRSGWKVWSS